MSSHLTSERQNKKLAVDAETEACELLIRGSMEKQGGIQGSGPPPRPERGRDGRRHEANHSQSVASACGDLYIYGYSPGRSKVHGLKPV